MLIPTGLHYTSVSEGHVINQVHCSRCGADYVYMVKRRAQGFGYAPWFLFRERASETASNNATAALQRKLERAVESVPCPTCGQVQDHMILAWRLKRAKWAAVVGLPLMAIVLFSQFGVREPNAFFASVLPVAIWAVPLATFLGMAIWWLIYNPNRGLPSSWKRGGFPSEGMLLEDYEAALEAQRMRTDRKEQEEKHQWQAKHAQRQAQDAAKRAAVQERKREEMERMAKRANGQ